ncbi:hypothetical protein NFJ02_23g51040 [Pycnococcus provasolii]
MPTASSARSKPAVRVEPSFHSKLAMLYVTVALDCIAAAYTDPLESSRGSLIAFYVCLQVALVFGTALAYFLVVSRVVSGDREAPSNIAYAQAGPSLFPPRLGLTWAQAGLMATTAHFVTLLAQRCHRIVLRSGGVPHAAVWDLGNTASAGGIVTTATTLMWLQRTVAIVYYLTLIAGANSVAGGEVLRLASEGKR